MKSRFGEHSQTAKHVRPATKTSLFETNTLKAVFIAGPLYPEARVAWFGVENRQDLQGLGHRDERTGPE